jgi:hypothetical protein
MPINHTAHAICLHNLNGWHLLEDSAQLVDSGWDTVRRVYASDKGILTTADDIVAEWPLGRSLGANMYLTECQPRALGGGIWAAEVVGKGLLQPRPVRTSGGASSLQRSVEDIDAFGIIRPKAEIWESTPTVEYEFITNQQPRTYDVGKSETPVNAPGVRESVWARIGDPTWHWPNGWVLADVRYEKHIAVALWLVTHLYEYRYEFTP